MIEDYIEWLNERNKLHFGTVERMLAKYKAAMQAAQHDKVGCPPESQSGVGYKPPLGLCPESVGLCPESVVLFAQNHDRIGDIMAAMIRYHAANKPIPLEVESQQRT